jgi:hypothetical protein
VEWALEKNSWLLFATTVRCAGTEGRILHHPYHAERCPFWRAEKERYPE